MHLGFTIFKSHEKNVTFASLSHAWTSLLFRARRLAFLLSRDSLCWSSQAFEVVAGFLRPSFSTISLNGLVSLLGLRCCLASALVPILLLRPLCLSCVL